MNRLSRADTIRRVGHVLQRPLRINFTLKWWLSEKAWRGREARPHPA